MRARPSTPSRARSGAQVCAALAALALGAAHGSARAQDRAAFAQARYQQGFALFRAGAFARALEAFRAALALYPSPNTRLYLARSLAELGRLDEAAAEYALATTEARDRARLDPRYGATADAAAEELAALEPRIARVRVRLAGVAPVPGLRVRVAGREVPAAALGLAVPVMPGVVRIAVDAREYVPVARAVRLAAGGRADVEVPLRAAPARGARPGALWVPGWVTLGAGALGLGTSAVAGALEAQQWQRAMAVCTPPPCIGDELALASAGRAEQTVANVALGVGVAGVVLGALFLVIARPVAPPLPTTTTTTTTGTTHAAARAPGWRF